MQEERIPGKSDKAKKECSFFMARQPLFNRDAKLIGYELLYRKSTGSEAGTITLADELTALSNVLVEVGLDRLAPKLPAFVNVPASLLGSSALRLLPTNRVVLEILEDTPWNSTVEQNLVNLKNLGYRLAIDDYVFGAQHDQFLRHVDIVKVDIMGMSPDRLKQQMQTIDRKGKHFLAEKVETITAFDFCRNLGFNYFQGYFMARPALVRGTGIPGNLGLSIAMIAKLNDANATLEDLEQTIAGNVVLCHKILRLANSVELRPPQGIDSLRQALQYLGIDRIRALASLVVATSIRGKPPELYNLALVRAYYCESLAKSKGFSAPEKHFLVGLLSVLDALTGLTMDTLLQELPLSAEVTSSLLGKAANSTYQRTLQHVFSVESGNWRAADAALPGVPEGIYMEAVGRARRDEQLLAA